MRSIQTITGVMLFLLLIILDIGLVYRSPLSFRYVINRCHAFSCAQQRRTDGSLWSLST